MSQRVARPNNVFNLSVTPLEQRAELKEGKPEPEDDNEEQKKGKPKA